MDFLIVGVVLIAVGGYLYYNKQKKKGRDIFNRPIDNRSEK